MWTRNSFDRWAEQQEGRELILNKLLSVDRFISGLLTSRKFRFTKCKGNFTLEVIGFCFKPDGLEFQPQAYKVDKDTRL